LLELNQEAPLSLKAMGQYSTYTSPLDKPDFFTWVIISLLSFWNAVRCTSMSEAAVMLAAEDAIVAPPSSSLAPASMALLATLASDTSPLVNAVLR
jgi:hypothetical protein